MPFYGNIFVNPITGVATGPGGQFWLPGEYTIGPNGFEVVPPTLPDFPDIEGDDPTASRPGTVQINRTSPPSPREFYANLVAIDDICPPVYGHCYAKGKPWLLESDQVNQARVWIAWGFSDSEVNDPQDFEIGDETFVIGGSGNLRSIDGGSLWLGDSAQNLPAVFNAHISGTYTDTHGGRVIFGKSFQPANMQGLPLTAMKAEWSKNIYDPRNFRGVKANGSATGADRFDVTDHANLRPTAEMSYEGWFALDSGATVAENRVIAEKSGASEGWTLYGVHTANNQPRISIWINTTTPVEKTLDAPANFASIVAGGKPVHVAFTYKASTQVLRLYVNRCLAAEATYTESPNGTIVTNTDSLEINQVGTDWGVTELRLWTDERTPTEIFDNAETRLVGTEAGLRAYWPIDDAAAASTLADKTGNGHTASKVGTNVTVEAEHLVGLAPASWCTRAYSNNAMLCAADMVDRYTTGIVQNWNDVADVADHCDTDLTGHPGVKRGTYNEALDLEQDWDEWLDHIAEHGWFVWWMEGDKVRYREDWIVASADDTLDEDNMMPETFQWLNGDPGYEEAPDKTGVRYLDVSTGEEGTAYDVAPDGSERFIDFVKMLGFNAHGPAKRYAIKKQSTYDNEPYAFSVEVDDRAAEWQKWDRIDVSYDRLGLVAVKCRLLHNPKRTGPGTYQCQFKLYSASTYDESNDAAPTINLSTIPSVGSIPTGPAPTLVEIFGFAKPTQFTARVRFDEPAWVHTKAIAIEVWNNAETEMLIGPIVILVSSLTEIAAGPPRSLEAIIEVPLAFDFKVATRIVNTLDDQGALSAYTAAVFASGFEDPTTIPNNNMGTQGGGLTHPDGRFFATFGSTWSDYEATLNYPYVLDMVCILETDDDGTGSSWRELDRKVLPADATGVLFTEVEQHYQYPSGGVNPGNLQDFRVTRITRNLFGSTKSQSQSPQPQDNPPVSTAHTTFIDRVEFDPDDDQRALIFFRFAPPGANTYFYAYALTVEDLSTNELVTYYDTPVHASIGDDESVSFNPIVINKSPIDPTSPFTHDAVSNSVPKTQDFVLGRQYRFTLSPTNISGQAMDSVQVTVTWGNTVAGGLDSSIN